MRLNKQGGFTLVELTVAMVVIATVAVAFFGLFLSLVNSTVVAKRRATALTLATGQMEYMKSLPYDNLIVQSPTSTVKTVNGVKYTIQTVVRYSDDAFDGCGSYPTQQQKEQYCRNYPPPTGSPTDTNPNDYKTVRIVALTNGTQLASVDTQIAARVAETSSTTGALFVTIVDVSGTPVSGATVTVANTTVTPNINKSDTSDANGVVIYYGLPPDSGTDYIVTASKSGYSTLSTISASGSLQPTYISQKILTQQSSNITLTLAPMSANSLVVEAVNTSGAPIANMRIYAKGGYKKFTSTADTQYYFDNFSPTDTRPTTDASGLAAITGLVPLNGYYFCGDDGSTNCRVGSTTYYLAAAVPYGGVSSLGPVTIPSTDETPSTTYPYNSVSHMQQVRLIFSTTANAPRVFTMNPYQLSLAGGNLSSFLVTITGANLSAATATFSQGATTFPSSGCSKTATQIRCSYNFSAATAGPVQLQVSNASGTVTLPTTPRGGFYVNP